MRSTAFAGAFRGFMRCFGARDFSRVAGAWIRRRSFPGQMEEIDRIYREYPELVDDAFVRQNLRRWLEV